MAIIPVNLQVEIPPVEMIGGIFPRRNVTVIASKAGVGKSMFAMWTCCQLSVGGDIFFSREREAPPRKVIYFAGEAGADLFVSRLHQCFEPRDYSKIFAFSAVELAKGGVNPYINVEANAELIFQIIQHYSPDAVFFDSLMGFISCNESDAGEMNKVMTTLKRWGEETNAAIICSHHMRKTDKKAAIAIIDQDEIIGSSIITRACGIAYIMQGIAETKSIRCVKSWWEKPEELSFKLSTAVNGKLAFLPSIATPEDNGTTLRIKTQNQLLRQIGQPIDRNEFCKQNDISKSTFYSAIEGLLTVKVDDDKVLIVGKK